MRRNAAKVVAGFAVGQKMAALKADRERGDYSRSEHYTRRLAVGAGEVWEPAKAPNVGV